MDKKRREQLRSILVSVRDASAIIERICDREQDSVYNTPENLQGTERFSDMEDNVDDLAEAQQHLDDAAELLQAVTAR